MKTFTLITASNCCNCDETAIAKGENLEVAIELFFEEICCKDISVIAAFEGTPIDILPEVVKKENYVSSYGGGRNNESQRATN